MLLFRKLPKLKTFTKPTLLQYQSTKDVIVARRAFGLPLLHGKFLGVFQTYDFAYLSSFSVPNERQKFRLSLETVYTCAIFAHYITTCIVNIIARLVALSSGNENSVLLYELVDWMGGKFSAVFVNIFITYNTKRVLSAIRLLINLILKMPSLAMTPQTTRIGMEPSKGSHSGFVSREEILIKFAKIAFICATVNALFENLMFDISIIQGIITSRNITWSLANNSEKLNLIFEDFYKYYCFGWSCIMPLNPLSLLGNTLAVMLLLGEKYFLLMWNYGDAFAIILSGLMTETLKAYEDCLKKAFGKFRNHCDKCRRVPIGGHSESTVPDKEGIESWWISMQHKYAEIHDAVEETSKLVYPLVLSCCGMNTYWLIHNIFAWMDPHETIRDRPYYNYFASASYAMKVFFVNYFAAQVYHTGTSLLKTIQDCPYCLTSPIVDRLERRMTTNPCAVSLFGTFTITNNIFVSIISLIFSIEIVLLQAQG